MIIPVMLVVAGLILFAVGVMSTVSGVDRINIAVIGLICIGAGAIIGLAITAAGDGASG